MRKLIVALTLMLSVAGFGQSFYTDRAVATYPINSQGVLIPIAYGQVRVCRVPAVGSPCTPVASVTDLAGTPLNVVGGNFGQITTDVVGRFNFGCTGGQNLQVQVAASGSNTPQLNYQITCPINTGNTSFGDVTALSFTGGSLSDPNTFGNTVINGFLGNALTVNGPVVIAGTGNVAVKYSTADHTIFVSPNGNDSNDGLSMGTAKLTSQAAFDAATSSGTVSGTVIFAPGNYSCPTTWYSNLEVHSLSRQYPFANVTDWGFSTTQSGALFGCTSGANHTIGPDLTNIFIDGIGFNFANAGGGLVINSVSASRFEHVYVELAGNATQEAVQLKVNAATGVQHNTAKNLFNDFNILGNTAGVGTQTDGLTLTGQGVVNTGVDVTDNWFTNLTIAGGLKNAIRFEKNTDSNYFSGVQVNNTGTAQGDVLVFNSTVPASDQDANAIILLGVASTGAFNHPVSMGQSSGNHVQIESAAEVVPNVLGGAPSYFVETIGLGGVQTAFSLNGLVRLTSSNVTGSDRIRMANGSAAGPSYSFAENTNTGFWKRSTLNEVIFAANGLNFIDFFNKAMRIDGQLGGYFFANGDPSANAEDTGVTRVAAKKVAVGGTAVGDSSGTLKIAAIEAGGTAATLSGTGACATNSTQTGGANGGRATCTGATAASTFVITPGSTAPTGWICSAFDQTTRANLLQQTSTTTGACTLTAASITQNDVIVFTAMAF